MPVAADALDIGQVGARLLDRIDVVRLEQVELRIRVDDDGSIEPIREVREGGRAAIEVPVVTAEEEINVRGIADDPEIDPIAHTRRLGREEILRSGPILGLGGVAISGVLGLAALEDQVPLVLGGEIEHLRGGVITRESGGVIHEIGRRGAGVVPIGEAQVFHAIVAR